MPPLCDVRCVTFHVHAHVAVVALGEAHGGRSALYVQLLRAVHQLPRVVHLHVENKTLEV